MIKLSTIRPNPKNPRVLRDDKFQKLKKSIGDFPKMMELRPIVVDDEGVILGGNMRFRALQDIYGKNGEIPDAWVKRAADLTEDEKRQFVIKDNAAFGEWDWDMLANEWDAEELEWWGIEPPKWDYTESEADQAEIEAKKREFAERMAAGDLSEEDEEYQQFIEKFIPKKTTDDCYTPALVYDAVEDWVANKYGVKKSAFVRPFYPGGDYKAFKYPKGCVVVDNPPFSILAEILTFYKEQDVRFFLFAPTLTLFSSSSSSSSSSSLCCGVPITYDNGANVNTSFLTNLEDRAVRFKSEPTLYKAVKEANDRNLEEQRREFPKYAYPDNIITAPFVARLSKYGIDYSVSVLQSCAISSLDSQKASGKAIYGKGYIVSEKAAAEKAAAEKAAAEKAAAEKAAAEKAAAEKAAATRWQLSEREKEIVAKLSAND